MKWSTYILRSPGAEEAQRRKDNLSCCPKRLLAPSLEACLFLIPRIAASYNELKRMCVSRCMRDVIEKKRNILAEYNI